MALPQSICNAGKPWTEKDLAKLEELAADNVPPCVIGMRLGRPQEAVEVKAIEAGITLSPANRPPYGVLQ
jgi:hypothetical protein